jgi:hypothetical protein
MGKIGTGVEKKRKELFSAKKGKKNPSSRRWCFTLYPERLSDDFFSATPGTLGLRTEEEISATLNIALLRQHLLYIPDIRGLLFSLEKGDSKEHIHVQGYFELSHPQRFTRLQNAIGYGVHLESARADREENRDYILHRNKHKDKGVLLHSEELGVWPKTSGDEKGCYDEAVAMILEGCSVYEVMCCFKGALLPQVSNLQKLRAEVEIKPPKKIAYVKREGGALVRAEEPMPTPY